MSLIKRIAKLVDNPRFIINYILLKKFQPQRSNIINNIFLFLTLRCNQRCVICGFWGEKGLCKDEGFFNLYKEDMPEDIALKLIDEVKELKPEIILTGGGEPLLNKNWYNIAKYAKKNRLKINLQTNGLLMDKYEDELLQVVDYLNVSLDAPNRELNDKIRGGGFDKVVAALYQLIKKRNKKNKPKINIWYTINGLNYSYLEEMVKFTESLNVDGIIFQHPSFANSKMVKYHKARFSHLSYFDKNIWSSVEFNLDIKLTELQTNIRNIKRKKYNLGIFFYPNLNETQLEEFYNDNINFKKNYCLSPYLECIIYPNGDVRLCQDYIIDNIKENNFLTIWNNEKAQQLRKEIKTYGLSTICKRCCNLYSY